MYEKLKSLGINNVDVCDPRRDLHCFPFPTETPELRCMLFLDRLACNLSKANGLLSSPHYKPPSARGA